MFAPQARGVNPLCRTTGIHASRIWRVANGCGTLACGIFKLLDVGASLGVAPCVGGIAWNYLTMHDPRP